MMRVVAAAVLLLAASSARAYELRPGDVTARAVVGPGINVSRVDIATKATPPFVINIGVDVDYLILPTWSVTASLRPGFTAGFTSGYLDANVGIGASYRANQLNAPLVPYAMAQAVFAAGFPTAYGDVHTNAGLRVGGGLDYFVLRNFLVGVQIASDVTHMFTPLHTFEWTVDASLTTSWRF
jgi:hypothetical protein